MKMSDLETMIAKRADDNVQARIQQFKRDIEAAVGKLFGDSGGSYPGFGKYKEAAKAQDAFRRAKAAVMALALGDTDEAGKRLGWPSELWNIEQQSLRTELLSKMDLLQQMLLAKPRNNENDVPQE